MASRAPSAASSQHSRAHVRSHSVSRQGRLDGFVSGRGVQGADLASTMPMSRSPRSSAAGSSMSSLQGRAAAAGRPGGAYLTPNAGDHSPGHISRHTPTDQESLNRCLLNQHLSSITNMRSKVAVHAQAMSSLDALTGQDQSSSQAEEEVTNLGTFSHAASRSGNASSVLTAAKAKSQVDNYRSSVRGRVAAAAAKQHTGGGGGSSSSMLAMGNSTVTGGGSNGSINSSASKRKGSPHRSAARSPMSNNHGGSSAVGAVSALSAAPLSAAKVISSGGGSGKVAPPLSQRSKSSSGRRGTQQQRAQQQQQQVASSGRLGQWRPDSLLVSQSPSPSPSAPSSALQLGHPQSDMGPVDFVCVGEGLARCIVDVPAFCTLQARTPDDVAYTNGGLLAPELPPSELAFGAAKKQQQRQSSFFSSAASTGADSGGGLKASMRGPSKPTLMLTDNGDGSYFLTYVANVSGSYILEARFHGEHVGGSPWAVQCTTGEVHPPSCCVRGLGASLSSAGKGDAATFTIAALDVYRNRAIPGQGTHGLPAPSSTGPLAAAGGVGGEASAFHVCLSAEKEWNPYMATFPCGTAVADEGNGTYTVTLTPERATSFDNCAKEAKPVWLAARDQMAAEKAAKKTLFAKQGGKGSAPSSSSYAGFPFVYCHVMFGPRPVGGSPFIHVTRPGGLDLSSCTFESTEGAVAQRAQGRPAVRGRGKHGGGIAVDVPAQAPSLPYNHAFAGERRTVVMTARDGNNNVCTYEATQPALASALMGPAAPFSAALLEPPSALAGKGGCAGGGGCAAALLLCMSGDSPTDDDVFSAAYSVGGGGALVSTDQDSLVLPSSSVAPFSYDIRSSWFSVHSSQSAAAHSDTDSNAYSEAANTTTSSSVPLDADDLESSSPAALYLGQGQYGVVFTARRAQEQELLLECEYYGWGTPSADYAMAQVRPAACAAAAGEPEASTTLITAQAVSQDLAHTHAAHTVTVRPGRLDPACSLLVGGGCVSDSLTATEAHDATFTIVGRDRFGNRCDPSVSASWPLGGGGPETGFDSCREAPWISFAAGVYRLGPVHALQHCEEVAQGEVVAANRALLNSTRGGGGGGTDCDSSAADCDAAGASLSEGCNSVAEAKAYFGNSTSSAVRAITLNGDPDWCRRLDVDSLVAVQAKLPPLFCGTVAMSSQSPRPGEHGHGGGGGSGGSGGSNALNSSTFNRKGLQSPRSPSASGSPRRHHSRSTAQSPTAERAVDVTTAALRSTAAGSPSAVARLRLVPEPTTINDNGDGTYTVSFPGRTAGVFSVEVMAVSDSAAPSLTPAPFGLEQHGLRASLAQAAISGTSLLQHHQMLNSTGDGLQRGCVGGSRMFSSISPGCCNLAQCCLFDVVSLGLDGVALRIPLREAVPLDTAANARSGTLAGLELIQGSQVVHAGDESSAGSTVAAHAADPFSSLGPPDAQEGSLRCGHNSMRVAARDAHGNVRTCGGDGLSLRLELVWCEVVSDDSVFLKSRGAAEKKVRPRKTKWDRLARGDSARHHSGRGSAWRSNHNTGGAGGGGKSGGGGESGSDDSGSEYGGSDGDEGVDGVDGVDDSEDDLLEGPREGTVITFPGVDTGDGFYSCDGVVPRAGRYRATVVRTIPSKHHSVAPTVRAQHPSDPGCRSGLRWIAGPVHPPSCTGTGVGLDIGGKVKEECSFILQPRDWAGNLCPYRDEVFTVSVNGPERCKVKGERLSDPAFASAAAAAGFAGLAAASGGSGGRQANAVAAGAGAEEDADADQDGSSAGSPKSRSRSRSRSKGRGGNSSPAGRRPGAGDSRGISALPMTLADVVEASTAITHDMAGSGRLLAPDPDRGYCVTYKPRTSGAFTVSCLLGGQHVSGSQFTVLVVPFTETFDAVRVKQRLVEMQRVEQEAAEAAREAAEELRRQKAVVAQQAVAVRARNSLLVGSPRGVVLAPSSNKGQVAAALSGVVRSPRPLSSAHSPSVAANAAASLALTTSSLSSTSAATTAASVAAANLAKTKAASTVPVAAAALPGGKSKGKQLNAEQSPQRSRGAGGSGNTGGGGAGSAYLSRSPRKGGKAARQSSPSPRAVAAAPDLAVRVAALEEENSRLRSRLEIEVMGDGLAKGSGPHALSSTVAVAALRDERDLLRSAAVAAEGGTESGRGGVDELIATVSQRYAKIEALDAELKEGLSDMRQANRQFAEINNLHSTQ